MAARAAIYVQDLRTGRGAAWNARRRFPAASTLKLAIAVTVLRSLDGKPPSGPGSTDLLGRCSIVSDNAARTSSRSGSRGSTSAGSDACQRDDARARAARLAHVRRLRDQAAGRPRATRFRSGSRASRASAWASTRPPGISRGSRARSTSRQPARGRCCDSASQARRRATSCGCSRRSPTAASSTAFSAPREVVMHKAGWLECAGTTTASIAFGRRRVRRERADVAKRSPPTSSPGRGRSRRSIASVASRPISTGSAPKPRARVAVSCPRRCATCAVSRADT